MQEFDYILLISKSCSGDITPVEADALQTWIARSDENARLAEQYQAAWHSASQSKKSFDIDLDAEFLRLQAKLQEVARPAPRRVPISRQLLRIAAAIALLLAGWWGYQQFQPDNPTLLVAKVEQAEKRQVTLPDGSRVWLRKNAVLEYPARFDKRERRVSLRGEAYFEVRHAPQQPFQVALANGGQVEVLGTQFNVAQTNQTSVLVRDGKVRFSPDGAHTGKILTKGEKATFDKKHNRLTYSQVATFNELAWQTGGLEFVQTPLKEVVRDLEQYYQVEIELSNPALYTCKHTAPLTNQSIDEVLAALSVVYHLQVSSPAPGRYVLSNGICQE